MEYSWKEKGEPREGNRLQILGTRGDLSHIMWLPSSLREKKPLNANTTSHGGEGIRQLAAEQHFRVISTSGQAVRSNPKGGGPGESSPKFQTE